MQALLKFYEINVALITGIVWPITLLIVIGVFRSNISNLIDNLLLRTRELSAWGVAAKFDVSGELLEIEKSLGVVKAKAGISDIVDLGSTKVHLSLSLVVHAHTELQLIKDKIYGRTTIRRGPIDLL